MHTHTTAHTLRPHDFKSIKIQNENHILCANTTKSIENLVIIILQGTFELAAEQRKYVEHLATCLHDIIS